MLKSGNQLCQVRTSWHGEILETVTSARYDQISSGLSPLFAQTPDIWTVFSLTVDEGLSSRHI